MTERKVEALSFNGETIYVEVAAIEQTGSGYEPVSATEEIVNAGEKIRQTISALAATVGAALEQAAPKEWTMEVTIGFKGSAGIPFVAQGEANGAVKVSAKWIRSG